MIDESMGKDTNIKKVIKEFTIKMCLADVLDMSKAEKKYEIVNFKRKLNNYVYDLKITTTLKGVVVNRNTINMEVMRRDEQRRKVL